jgi:restriction endonuclease S subunit
MYHKLSNFAEVQMGFSFRDRLERKMGGVVSVIQMKDLMENKIVNCSELVQVDLDQVKERHLVKKNDLVFRSRGLQFNTAILNDDPGTAVVASPLIRIRINDLGFIMPEFLSWYISQSDAQTFFSRHGQGSAQKMISKEDIEELSVMVPEIKKQKAIVELASLSDREQKLMNKLAKKRKMFISMHLMKIAIEKELSLEEKPIYQQETKE